MKPLNHQKHNLQQEKEPEEEEERYMVSSRRKISGRFRYATQLKQCRLYFLVSK